MQIILPKLTAFVRHVFCKTNDILKGNYSVYFPFYLFMGKVVNAGLDFENSSKIAFSLSPNRNYHNNFDIG